MFVVGTSPKAWSTYPTYHEEIVGWLRKTKLWLGLDPQDIHIIKTESGLEQLARTQIIFFSFEVETSIKRNTGTLVDVICPTHTQLTARDKRLISTSKPAQLIGSSFKQSIWRKPTHEEHTPPTIRHPLHANTRWCCESSIFILILKRFWYFHCCCWRLLDTDTLYASKKGLLLP